LRLLERIELFNLLNSLVQRKPRGAYNLTINLDIDAVGASTERR
jgi:hypothetical protein